MGTGAEQLWKEILDKCYEDPAALESLLAQFAEMPEARDQVARGLTKERAPTLAVLCHSNAQPLAQRVLPELVALADSGHQDIGLVRRAIKNVPRETLAVELWPLMKANMPLDDYEPPRRYAELLYDLGDEGSLRNLLQFIRDTGTTDVDWLEVVQDFDGAWENRGFGEKLPPHFEGIFTDAQVVDVDLSRWDKSIGLYVLADHGSRADGRTPLFRIEFERVRDLQLEIDAREAGTLATDEHLQWRIDDFEFAQDEEGIRVSLWGAAASPRLAIRCENLEIYSFEPTEFDELYPGWNAPGRGLARPGPDAMRNGPRPARYANVTLFAPDKGGLQGPLETPTPSLLLAFVGQEAVAEAVVATDHGGPVFPGKGPQRVRMSFWNPAYEAEARPGRAFSLFSLSHGRVIGTGEFERERKRS